MSAPQLDSGLPVAEQTAGLSLLSFKFDTYPESFASRRDAKVLFLNVNFFQSAQMPPPNVPIRPVRPFHQVPNTTVDKIVDYFFSDGPNNRFVFY